MTTTNEDLVRPELDHLETNAVEVLRSTMTGVKFYTDKQVVAASALLVYVSDCRKMDLLKHEIKSFKNWVEEKDR